MKQKCGIWHILNNLPFKKEKENLKLIHSGTLWKVRLGCGIYAICPHEGPEFLRKIASLEIFLRDPM